MQKSFASLLIIVMIILTSCLTITKSVKYMKPADITIPAKIKTIAILPAGRFKHAIYDVLLEVFGDEAVKARFDVIDRQNIDRILEEQNLYNSDEFNDNTAVELGQLSGAQAVIVGAFKDVRKKTNKGTVVLKRKYFVKFKHVNGRKIPIFRYIDENVQSIIKSYHFSIDIRMLNIESGTLIHNEKKSFKAIYEIYQDNKPDRTVSVVKTNAKNVNVFPDIIELFNMHGVKFAKYFAKKVAPYYVNEDMDFERIGRDDVNKRFIKLIMNDLYDEAFEIMNNNLEKINVIEKSKIRAKHYYNIGCVYELQNDFENSQKYYKMAVNEDPTNLHLVALKAIQNRIKDKNKLDQQIKMKETSNNEDW